MAIRRGYIYAVGNREHGWVKVGMTRDIKGRMIAIHTGCPVVVELLAWGKHHYAYLAETHIHEDLADLRLRDNGEWFKLDEERIRKAMADAGCILGLAGEPLPEAISAKRARIPKADFGTNVRPRTMADAVAAVNEKHRQWLESEGL